MSASARPDATSTASAPRAAPDDSALVVRTGSHRPVPLRFWQQGEAIYAIASSADARWAIVALRDGRAELARDGRASDWSVARVTDAAEAETARSGMHAKYGTELWRAHFGHAATVVRFDPRRSTSGPSDEGRIRGAFDEAAPTYAARVAGSPVQRYLKARTTTWLVRSLTGHDPLLEIGPGVGLETIPLLAAGHSIVAVDLAPAMLGELRARADAAGVGNRLTTVTAGLRELDAALGPRFDGSFGAAYSTFGAFNLESEVGMVSRTLGRLLRPGSPLLFTSLNRPGLTPWLWELAAGRVGDALGRRRELVRAGESSYSLDVHLRSAEYWDRLLTDAFERVDARAVSVLAPPFDSPRLTHLFGAAGRRRAARLDDRLSRQRMLAPFGEWVGLSYRRRTEESGRATSSPRAAGSVR
jgi:SAM-dependent methyltransferase